MRTIKRSSSDTFYAVAGNPPSITPPGPSLFKAAAQSNPHNDELLASPRGFFLRRLSNADPQDGLTALMTGRHPKPFTKAVIGTPSSRSAADRATAQSLRQAARTVST
jgi:hypothetical protein